MMLTLSSVMLADEEIEQVKSKLPKLLGANNFGTEFWFSIPPCYEDESAGGDNFVKIFVTSQVETDVLLEVPGKAYQIVKTTVPNNVIGFDITPDRASPYLYGGRSDDPKPEDIYQGVGIHVVSNEPVAVYVMVRYRYTSDGFLAIPVASLGTEHIVASYTDMVGMYSWAKAFPSFTTITAAFDDTDVSFTMGGNEISETAGGLAPGESTQVNLNAGDVWIFASNGAGQDLTGSKIESSKPVAVVSGNHCTNIPISNRWCDYTVEADMPTNAWGYNYHVGKMPNRKFSGLVRIFAKEAETNIYRNGNQIYYLPQGGGVEGEGWFEMRVMDSVSGSAVFSGDKPINVVFYNPGPEEDMANINSDPFAMAITPVELFQTEITFCTPAVKGGMNFSENYLNLIYQTDEFGNMPDDVEFAEVYNDTVNWRRVNTAFPSTDYQFEYDIDGKHYALKQILLPGDGVYKIRAIEPFGCYSFGFSYCDSYGYPTSASVMDIGSGDSLMPTPMWFNESGGAITKGTITDPADSKGQKTNLADIFFLKQSSDNYEFQCEKIIPGQTETANWELKVFDIKKDAKAFLLFFDRAGNDTLIKVSYSAPKVSVEPQAFHFGTVMPGSKSITTITIENLSANSLDISKIQLEHGLFGFSIENDFQFPITLAPNQKYSVNISFTTLGHGNYRDALLIYVGDIVWETPEIKASTPDIDISPEFYKFNKVSIPDLAGTSFEIINNSNSEIEISDIKLVNGSAGFKISNNITFPLRLAQNERYTLNITFDAKEEGDFADVIEIYLNNILWNEAKVSATALIPTSVNNSGFEFSFPEISPNPVTSGIVDLKFTTESSGNVEIRIFSINSSFEKTIFSGNLNAGNHSIPFSTDNLSAGVYFVELKSNNNKQLRKIVITK